MSEKSPNGTPARVRDLNDEAGVMLTCRNCETSWTMTKDLLLRLTPDYMLLSNFADRHICGQCNQVGSFVEVLVSE